MRAITYASYGPPEVLQVSEVERPVQGEDEVLIRVRAAEVTKADCEMRSFRFAVKWFWLPLRIAMGILRPRQPILGGYFAGEVQAVGKDVENLMVGESVFGCARTRFGAHAEYVALPASYTIVRKPDRMSFEEAAAVPLGGLNALHFMRLANIQPGESVLINGAGGSIGAHAIQIAKSMGACVTAVDKGSKEAFVRRMGADKFVDYLQEAFSGSGAIYDVVFDMVPGKSYSACITVLKDNGRYLSGNPTLWVMIRCIAAKWFTKKTATFAFAGETTEELLLLKEMIDEGKIKSIVDRVYSMGDAQEAHRRVETEERLGAIVIDTGQ
jgi:NADPH:quinone reductase-like Zn-dependent oxidoreductase